MSKRISDKYNLILKFLPKDGFLLEAGCGSGSVVCNLLYYDFEVVGIDLSFEATKKRCFITKTSNKKTRLVKGNLFNLPFKDKSFSSYISLGVIEHYSDSNQKKIIQEARRILEEESVIFVTVPNRLSCWTLFRWLYSKMGAKYCWQKSMTKEILKKRFVELGFEPILSLNFDVWSSFRRSFCLEERKLKHFIPNPLYIFKNFFKHIALVCERKLPILGYNSLFIGKKSNNLSKD